MSKFLMIELMLLYGQISMDRAEELTKAHYDTVESEWFSTVELEGAFVVGALDGYA